ncbi:MAG: hypothetical protein NZ585_01195 [Chloracidobacterium sp.]|nr:hypothetical protein [Chloracidobacterium sp.]MDW8216378.1 hypothetical protein [Acidobacteriota bacterium]
MTTKFATDTFATDSSKIPSPPSRRTGGRDRLTPTPAFQPNMFEDDLVSALAVATENVRARQVFAWECVRRRCAV